MRRYIYSSVLLLSVLFAMADSNPSTISFTSRGGDDNFDAWKVDEMLTVTLNGNPTTGYSWQVLEYPENLVQQLGEGKYVATPVSPGIVGSGGSFHFSFKAIARGSGDLRFIYVRPWEFSRWQESNNSTDASLATVHFNVSV
eukprot:GILK01003708.1.p1 GENE.GILK01003708.1~~GILK01003708.1.p1  ORF type:complete len:142 (-),score=13.06 GILK01003708.1:131-556(-)